MAESEHRNKTVEAVLPYVEPSEFGEGTDRMRRENAVHALAAADPHLRRMYFERFAEKLLSDEALSAAATAFHDARIKGDPAPLVPAFEALLDSIREGEDG